MYDELIKLGRGDSRYTQGVLGVCPKVKNAMATHKECVGWMESLKLCS